MRMPILCLALVSAMGVAACNRTNDTPNTPPPPAPTTSNATPDTAAPPASTTTGQSTSTATDVLQDTAITAKVKAALATTDDLKDSAISVETTDGKVVLTGRLPDETQHQKAKDVVRGVEGVRDVESRIVIGNS